MRARSRDLAVAALLGIAAAAVLLPLRRQGLMLTDEGWALLPSLGLLEGRLPYRDFLTYYAPLRYHLLAGWLAAAGPTLLAARTFWLAGVAVTVACTWLLARRFAPARLAWIPAATWALAPGPWPFFFYGLCTTVFFLAFARLVEAPARGRLLTCAVLAGVVLFTRQELGLAQACIVLATPLALRLGLRAGARGDAVSRAPLRATALAAAGITAGAAPFAVGYAAAGALGEMLQLVFGTGFTQMRANAFGLPALLSPGSFAHAPEGRFVGVLMLAPLVVYAGLGLGIARTLVREGVVRRLLLPGALLAYGGATLVQAYMPVLLPRLLQSAIPFYVLATFAVAAVGARWRAAGHSVWARGLELAFAAAAAAVVANIVFGIPAIGRYHEYTGSWRAARYDRPVRITGDDFFVDWRLQDEIRMLRAFYDARTAPGEPTFVAPQHSLYYVILERSNPTAFLAEHIGEGDFIADAARKQEEMRKLLRSGARFAIAERNWLAWPAEPDAIRATLLRSFHPVREYQSMTVLARGADALDRQLTGAYLRIVRGASLPGDLALLERVAAAKPAEPLPWMLLGIVRAKGRDAEGAVQAFRRAARLDPADPRPLERAAALLLHRGRHGEAGRLLAQALAVREAPPALALLEQLHPNVRARVLRSLGEGRAPGGAGARPGAARMPRTDEARPEAPAAGDAAP